MGLLSITIRKLEKDQKGERIHGVRATLLLVLIRHARVLEFITIKDDVDPLLKLGTEGLGDVLDSDSGLCGEFRTRTLRFSVSWRFFFSDARSFITSLWISKYATRTMNSRSGVASMYANMVSKAICATPLLNNVYVFPLPVCP